MTGAVREERRLVTCMFVDVVGSTELTMTFGAERLKQELGKAFAEISRTITLHGGTVEKYVGDAIYAIFGAPIAHEDDTLRALRAAEAVRDWCAAGAAGHPFAIRIGIETGEAVIDLTAAEHTKQQMSVGPVVNTAARLQQRAEPGEILVGPAARSATEGSVELEPLADAELKGIGRMQVWRLVRVGGAARPSLPFVGREAELGLLGHAYERARKGRSVLAVVSGPPGQGKTRVVQEFIAQHPDIHLIPTRCRPADETGVFAPVREILGVTTLDALAEQVGHMCADDIECERVVAGLAESAGISSSRSLASLPSAEREDEIVQAWRRYLAMLGADRLVVLAIDDIHWADASLVRLVDRITFGGPRVLVVATARPEFAEASGIRPSGDRFFIELEGLEPDEARHLAEMAGRGDDQVVARAEGNPLFLVELARAQIDRVDLPLTLQGALGARLDQLPGDDRVLLSVAAVAGEPFSAADAAFLAGSDAADTGRRLARLVDLHFLDESERGYRFHHGLIRETAYGRLLTAERMRTHARFARERVHPEDAETLAYHWWAALRPPDAEWVWADDGSVVDMRREALRATLAAARKHADHAAMQQAVELGERALALADDDADRAAAHRAIAAAYRAVLRMDEAWDHLQRAAALYGSAGRVPAEVYVEFGEALGWYGAFKKLPAEEEALAVFESGAAAARGDALALARVLVGRARYAISMRHPDRAAHLDEAIAAAEAARDPALLRRALLLKANFAMGQGRLEEAGQLLDEVRRSPVRVDGLERLTLGMVSATYHHMIGDLAAHAADIAELLTVAEPMGPHNRTHAWQNAADMYLARGSWAEIGDLAQRTAKLIVEERSSAFCVLAALVIQAGAAAHALAGRRDDAQALLRLIDETTDRDVAYRKAMPRALLGLDPGIDPQGQYPWFDQFDLAVAAVARRHPDDALAAVEKMAKGAQTSPPYLAFIESVREVVAELRGGPPATFDALRKVGYVGWIDLLKHRASPRVS